MLEETPFLKWKENRRDTFRIAGFQHPKHLSILPSEESFFAAWSWTLFVLAMLMTSQMMVVRSDVRTCAIARFVDLSGVTVFTGPTSPPVGDDLSCWWARLVGQESAFCEVEGVPISCTWHLPGWDRPRPLLWPHVCRPGQWWGEGRMMELACHVLSWTQLQSV